MNDQKTMDFIVNQSQEILKLKNENYELKVKIMILEKEISFKMMQLEQFTRKELEANSERI